MPFQIITKDDSLNSYLYIIKMYGKATRVRKNFVSLQAETR